MAGAAAGNDEPRIDDGADERYALVNGLFILFMWMESEFELLAEIFFDNTDITKELFALLHGDDDEKVVDVTTIMFVAKVELDEAIELVKEDIGEELASEITDNDAAFFGLVEEAFISGEFVPVTAVTVDADTVHRFVINDFVPDVLEEVVELVFVGGMTTNAVFVVGEFTMEELAFETPEDTFVE